MLEGVAADEAALGVDLGVQHLQALGDQVAQQRRDQVDAARVAQRNSSRITGVASSG